MPKAKSKIEEYERKQLIFSVERTLLSKERTILSFMQTGIACMGIGLVITFYFKETAINAVGYALMLIGFIEVIESIRRLKLKQIEMHRLKKQGAI